MADTDVIPEDNQSIDATLSAPASPAAQPPVTPLNLTRADFSSPAEFANYLNDSRGIPESLHHITDTLVDRQELGQITQNDLLSTLDSYDSLHDGMAAQYGPEQASSFVALVAEKAKNTGNLDDFVEDVLEDGDIDKTNLFESLFGSDSADVQAALAGLAQQGIEGITQTAYSNKDDDANTPRGRRKNKDSDYVNGFTSQLAKIAAEINAIETQMAANEARIAEIDMRLISIGIEEGIIQQQYNHTKEALDKKTIEKEQIEEDIHNRLEKQTTLLEEAHALRVEATNIGNPMMDMADEIMAHEDKYLMVDTQLPGDDAGDHRLIVFQGDSPDAFYVLSPEGERIDIKDLPNSEELLNSIQKDLNTSETKPVIGNEASAEDVAAQTSIHKFYGIEAQVSAKMFKAAEKTQEAILNGERVAELKVALEETNKEISELQSELNELEQTLKDLGLERADLEKERSELSQEQITLKDRLDNLENQEALLSQKQGIQQNQIQATETLTAKLKSDDFDMFSLIGDIKSYLETDEKHVKEMSSLEEQITDLQEKKASLETEQNTILSTAGITDQEHQEIAARAIQYSEETQSTPYITAFAKEVTGKPLAAEDEQHINKQIESLRATGHTKTIAKTQKTIDETNAQIETMKKQDMVDNGTDALTHERNFEHEAAVKAGAEYANCVMPNGVVTTADLECLGLSPEIQKIYEEQLELKGVKITDNTTEPKLEGPMSKISDNGLQSFTPAPDGPTVNSGFSPS